MTPQSVLVVVGLWVAGGPGSTVWPPGTGVGAGSSVGSPLGGAAVGEAAATSVESGEGPEGEVLDPAPPQAPASSAIGSAMMARRDRIVTDRTRGTRSGRNVEDPRRPSSEGPQGGRRTAQGSAAGGRRAPSQRPTPWCSV